MTFEALLKHLTENLSDEQKKMDAEVLSDDGSTWVINTILITAVGEGGIKEGQAILAGFETPITASPRT